MRGTHASWTRWLAAAGLLLTLGAPAVLAAEAPPPAPAAPTAKLPDAAAWQGVITGQVEAFRRGDAVAAFGFAGAPFQKAFPDATSFMLSIAAAGYAPIFISVSHSFGEFQQVDATTVVQQVTFNGPNQDVYIAIYLLTLEPAGWRVEGVQLAKEDMIGA